MFFWRGVVALRKLSPRRTSLGSLTHKARCGCPLSFRLSCTVSFQSTWYMCCAFVTVCVGLVVFVSHRAMSVPLFLLLNFVCCLVFACLSSRPRHEPLWFIAFLAVRGRVHGPGCHPRKGTILEVLKYVRLEVPLKQATDNRIDMVGEGRRRDSKPSWLDAVWEP